MGLLYKPTMLNSFSTFLMAMLLASVFYLDNFITLNTFIDMLLFPSSTLIFLRSILGQVTLAVYLALGLGCHLIETN